MYQIPPGLVTCLPRGWVPLSVGSKTPTISYGLRGVTALDAICLTIPRGEMVSIVGRSGSGKSTLLNLVGGLDRTTSGDLRVDGNSLANLSDDALTKLRRDKIGFVFKKFNLLPTLTARGNIEIARYIHGNGKASHANDQHLVEILQLLLIQDKMGRKPSELSGGEQQRVAIARALANHPSLLLADEPTGNLDPRTAAGVFEALVSLVHAEGLAALVATHNSELAQKMDRSLLLQDGRLIEGTK